MKIVHVSIEGISEMCQSRFHDTPKLQKELPHDYEGRTWRNKLHINDDGYVEVTALMWKNSIGGAAKYLSLQVPGKGKSTYTKHFEAGILVLENSATNVKVDDVKGDWMLLPSDGVAGSGKRVKKCMPKIPKGWQANVIFHVIDDIITEDVFRKHLSTAGLLIGIGTFRPRNRGLLGRFMIKDMKWEEQDITKI